MQDLEGPDHYLCFRVYIDYTPLDNLSFTFTSFLLHFLNLSLNLSFLSGLRARLETEWSVLIFFFRFNGGIY